MTRYKDIDGDSGIEAYEVSSDSIIVQFKRGGSYCYSYASAGKSNVEKMKRLAESGDGLNAFINANVKNDYEWKR